MAEPRRIISSHFFSLPVVWGAATDPAHRRVAYVRTLADQAANAYRGSIRVCELAGGATTVLTHGTARDGSPAWTPDGTRIVFTSDRSGSMQLWCIDLAGGEAYALPAIEGCAVSDFAISPDGKRIAAVATSLAGKREVDERGWRRITRQRYRGDGIGYHDSLPQVWIVDLERGASRALTDATGFVAAPAWSPDGARVAYAADRTANADGVALRELWVADVDRGDMRCLTAMRGVVDAPAWSLDGARIAFLGSDDPRAQYGQLNVRLFTIGANGGNAQCITPSVEWGCGDLTIVDTVGGRASLAPQFLPGGAIAVLGTQRGATRVFVIGQNRSVRAATPEGMCVVQYSHAGRDEFVCAASASGVPPELYRIAGGEARRLTFETKAWCGERGVRAASPLSAKGRSGPIQGWRLRGDGPEPRRCILQLHGGPHAAYGDAFFFEFQLLAAAGYDVVYCNPRGSQGYGEPFAGAIIADWGDPALDDCLAVLDAAVHEGGIEEGSVGVAGGSYGGYLTAWTVSHSQRFRAAVAMRGAYNLESLWGTSEVGRMLESELGGRPDQVPDVYRRCSPLTHAEAIATPLLLIHSERDYRCPIEQAEQLFTALTQRGREVELLRFSEADHGLSRTGPPGQRVARLDALLDWFDRKLVRPA